MGHCNLHNQLLVICSYVAVILVFFKDLKGTSGEDIIHHHIILDSRIESLPLKNFIQNHEELKPCLSGSSIEYWNVYRYHISICIYHLSLDVYLGGFLISIRFITDFRVCI